MCVHLRREACSVILNCWRSCCWSSSIYLPLLNIRHRHHHHRLLHCPSCVRSLSLGIVTKGVQNKNSAFLGRIVPAVYIGGDSRSIAVGCCIRINWIYHQSQQSLDSLFSRSIVFNRREIRINKHLPVRRKASLIYPVRPDLDQYIESPSPSP